MAFGYLPLVNSPSFFRQPRQWFTMIRHRLEGFNNLLKRIQTTAVRKALSLSPQDNVLEIGAGSYGYASEFSKKVGSYLATDVVDLRSIASGYRLPPSLRVMTCDVHNLLLEDATFDVVLMSEVIPVLKDPVQALTEVKRVMKPSGRLVMVNGGQYLHVRGFYTSRNPVIRRLLATGIRRGHIPPTYEEYHANLLKFHGTNPEYFHDREAFIETALCKAGFYITGRDYSVRKYANYLYQLICFSRMCHNGSMTLSSIHIYLLPLLKLLDCLCRTGRGMAFITIAKIAKNMN